MNLLPCVFFVHMPKDKDNELEVARPRQDGVLLTQE
jgi:hypothetical protein